MKSIIKKFGLAVAAMAIILTGCKDDEKDPVAPTFDPASASVVAGNTVQVSITGGEAPFELAGGDAGIARTSVSGSTISIEGVAAGSTNVTVIGNDNGRATLSVSVTARPSTTPTLSATTATIATLGGTQTITISGGVEPYTVENASPHIAATSLSGSTITVTGNSNGSIVVAVKGSDGAAATFTADVTGGQKVFHGNAQNSFTQIGSGTKEFEITQDLTIKKGVYTMVGWIYVVDGVTLTIEPGTIIKGSDVSFDGATAATGSSLIIERGAKIMAEGTVSEPIVFTSAREKGRRQASDWGGIVILGKASHNEGDKNIIEGGLRSMHGGTDDDDNSGIFKYCRIEFAGYPYAQDNEINGLTMGSVGRGTTIEYVQVSYCGDDSFEWFGGTVNGRYLIAYHGWDDDFDTDRGYSGKLQFLLGVRDPRIADTSNSNGFESDNHNSTPGVTPFTRAVFSNVTIIGPIGQDDPFSNQVSPAGRITGYGWGTSTTAAFPIKPGIFQAAMHIRRGSQMSCFNSVFTGYPVGLILESDISKDAFGNELVLENIHFAEMGLIGADANNTANAWSGDVSKGLIEGTTGYKYYNTIDGAGGIGLKDFKSKTMPVPLTGGFAANNPNANWGPTAGSPLRASGAASFAHAKLNDPFFKVVDYAGAFASDADADNWTKGWANFDPQNTDY